MRTSLIAGKDLKNSISDYSTRLKNKKLEVRNNKQVKSKFQNDSEKIDDLLSAKFKSNKISDSEYTEIRQEMAKLKGEYESQLWKQKYIINFLALKEEQLDLQELNRMYTEIQLRKEKELITTQHFVLKLKEITVTQARSLVAYVTVANISKVLMEFSRASEAEREILVDFLEKVKFQLKKDGLEQDCSEAMPFGVLEKTISGIFTKWEREKLVLEAFIGDIMNVFCEEFNLSKEDVKGNKPKNKRELELKVVAEFINMYLEKLHNSIESKIRGLENLKKVIENGKEIQVSWSEILLKHVKIPDKTVKKEPTLVKSSSKPEARSKSPKDKKTPHVQKKNPVKKVETKTNVGKNTKKYTNSKLSAIPEERKRSPVGLSRKNPLDSIASFHDSLDEGMEDIISDLNPSKAPAKQLSLFSKPQEVLRKPEMDSTAGLFNFKSKPAEKKEVFSSVEASLFSQTPQKRSSEFVYKSISDLESVKFPKKSPETRSELIMSGVQPFNAYMSQDGSVFNPQEKFPHIKAADVDPLDPYFLEEIGNLSPNPSTDWYLRSHHLRSFTNHPLSVNDNPNFYKAQMRANVHEEVSKPHDQRDIAISHLEKTLEDLRCELDSRKRISAVNSFANNDNRFTGHLSKVVNPIAEGLNMNEKEGLVMHTYESILDELRNREKAILNEKRAEEYERNRPPQGNWFELKSSEFTQEIHRHMSSLKPKEEHRKLLNHLAIPDLY